MDIHIMLVDDDHLNIAITQKILEKNGYTVQSFPNGLDALQGYHLMPCSVILMDCEMPVMNGFDTAQAIRNIETENGLSASKIIAITSHTHTDVREKCKNSGMNGFLPKPYKPFELIEMVTIVQARQNST